MKYKEIISSSSSSSFSSSQNTTKEEYYKVKRIKFSSCYKEDYIKHQVSDPRFNDDLIHTLGDTYQNVVNKILKDDIFKDFDFFEDKNGIIKFNFNENYNLSNIKFGKGFIAPDFFIHKIWVKEFFEILKQRSYMMRTSYKMNTKINYISIIGEIKSSHKNAHKSDKQRNDYLQFTQKAKSSEEDILIMYIYDEYFQLFKQDLSNKLDKSCYILCYIPKLYKEDCYHSFNITNRILNSKDKKIDINKQIRKYQEKKELIKELEKCKNKEKFYIIINTILILIILFLLIDILFIQ